MNEPQINVDHFYHRPTYRVVGLLTDKSEVPAISAELRVGGPTSPTCGGAHSSRPTGPR